MRKNFLSGNGVERKSILKQEAIAMKRTAIAAAVAVLLAGTAHAASTEFILYKGQNFSGPSQVIKGEVANLEGGFAREGSSAVVRGGNWEICTQDHFRGDCYIIAPGEYPDLGRLHDKIVAVRFVGNDKVAHFDARDERKSLRQELKEAKREAREDIREARRDLRDAIRGEDRRDRDGWRDSYAAGTIDLYGQPGFRGRSLRIDDNTRDLADYRFDGRASSAVVHSGTWQLCTEPRYEGRCEVLRPGEYPQLAMLDDRVSSLRQVR